LSYNLISFSVDSVTGTLYNGTSCDPNLVWQQHTLPANQCVDGSLTGDSDDDYYLIGESQEEIFCTSNVAFPLPGAYDWVAAV
jgi:hypothetical protein